VCSMALFFGFIFFFDIFHMVAISACCDAWMACSNDVIRNEHILDLVYSLMRIVYLGFELSFCFKFNMTTFHQNTLLLIGLAVIQATNVSCWLDAWFHESFSSEDIGTYELSRCFNGTDVNVSDHFVQCFTYTTGEYKLVEDARPYLFPFIMEYLMLAFEFVAHCFFSDAARASYRVDQLANNGQDTQALPTDTRPQHEADENINQALPSLSSGSQRGGHSGSIHEENKPLLPSSEPSANNGRGRQADETTSSRQDVSVKLCDRYQNISIVLSAILSLVFLILGILILNVSGYWNGFLGFRVAYWLMLCLAALVGLVVSWHFKSGPMNPNGYEYFVILSGIGPILQCMFTIVASVHSAQPLFLIEEVINIVQILTQMFFYTYAKRIQITTTERYSS